MGGVKVCVVVYRFACEVLKCALLRTVSMGSVKLCVVVYRFAWEMLKYVLLSTGLHVKF
jgi:hypothetical protein